MTTFVFLFILVSGYATSDEEQIKQTVIDAYVNGIQNAGSIEKIEAGFHPCFELIGIGKDGKTVWKNPIYTWKEKIEQFKLKNPEGKEDPVSCEFEFIDITGKACVSKIRLNREGKHIFTDYLSLYKFENGWRIVSKIYNRH